MRVATMPRPSSERSAKDPRPVISRNHVKIHEINTHYRRELGLSRRDSDYLTRRVYLDADLAHATLPERWADALHPGPTHLMPLDRITEAGNVGPDRTPTFGRDQHDAFKSLTRRRQRAAATEYARRRTCEAVTAA